MSILSEMDKVQLFSLYKMMLRIRLFEEKIVQLYPDQEIKTPVHLYVGQEAVASGVCLNLRKEDYVFTGHRSHGVCIAKGMDINLIMAELYGKRTGCSKGKGGSMHLVDPEHGILGTSSIVGGIIPIAVGLAMALKMKKSDSVCVCFFGDGAVDQGVFYESLNFASLKKLPIVFVCENNFYASHSPLSNRQSVVSLSEKGKIFSVPGVTIDGNNILEVFETAKIMIEKARNAEGPALIEAATYRWYGHVGISYDEKFGYRSREEIDSWIKKCPIKRLEHDFLENKLWSEHELERIKDKISDEIEASVRFAKASPYPSEDELLEDVY